MRPSARPLACLVALVVTGTLAAPAHAATPAPVSQAQAKRALLAAEDMPKGWKHNAHAVAGGLKCLSGTAKNVGIATEVGANWRYASEPLYYSEDLQSYHTAAQAKANFTANNRSVAACGTYVEGGVTWKLTPVRISRRGDAAVEFRVAGVVTSDKGDVPVTTYLTVVLVGRHQVYSLMSAGIDDGREFRATVLDATDAALDKVEALLPR
ncbi:hypothetical protein EV189_1074 [Motilibacter rhizosphaerae]|uniref:PknH-like protein n=1 Tax=Motilibacter rhizosphaerae TaxID=598652 RepID=A0A4Q7NZF7_9ACTN|nr:hypothetical protein [Motilibacter rhizosphaerae]RZS91822.1 hypothetical protein EV189_1074 [Motilibacter rhizosphaerae]